MIRLRSAFAAVVLALLGGLVVAPQAFAVDVGQEGYRTIPLYHNGIAAQGTITVRTAVEVYYNAGQVTQVRGFSMVTRGTKAIRAQVDRVELVDRSGLWRVNGVRRNTGSAASAKSYTGWVPATYGTGTTCTTQSAAQVRTYYSTRWADGTLTRGSVQSFVSYSEFCRR